ncbi:uncharacterized protein LOC124437254 [Xenia sp. Carnegie-2017]|uniref:uncharacterized protein LOC124437254 n=1 Tax=Xenia sp. Carnegie-2017 TaxID=2897299 RepID=UPI001F0375E1|nr:uncharacterized protein LOC124437254 [Xenia sp. Carnegie-2017]
MEIAVGKFSVGLWILESVSLLVAIITLGVFINTTEDEIHKWNNIGALTYGLSVTIISIISFVPMIVFHLRINAYRQVLWSKVILGLLIFTAGCVIANTRTNYGKDEKDTTIGRMTFCQWLKESKNHVNCDYLVSSSAFCFVASFTLIIEAFIMMMKRRRENQSNNQSSDRML